MNVFSYYKKKSADTKFIAYLTASLLHFYWWYLLKGFLSADAELFLLPWFDTLQKGGGLRALADYPGNYNAPYMTLMALMTYLPVKPLNLIKFLSLVFDYFLALGIMGIVKETTGSQSKAARGYCFTLLLPTVIMNSGMWGQCDAIYSSFAVWAVLLLLRRKYGKAFLMLGLSFAFKLQAVFLLPVFIILYFSRKEYPIYYFLLIPLVDLVACTPALLCGMPIKRVLTVYFEQSADPSAAIVSSFPNLYVFAQHAHNPEMIRRIGIAGAILFFFLLLLYCVRRVKSWTKDQVVLLSIVSVTACVTLLPNMHERYAYIAEVLAIAYYLWDPAFFIPAAVLVGMSLVTYWGYLIGRVISPLLYGMSILYTLTFLWILILFIKRTGEKEGHENPRDFTNVTTGANGNKKV